MSLPSPSDRPTAAELRRHEQELRDGGKSAEGAFQTLAGQLSDFDQLVQQLGTLHKQL